MFKTRPFLRALLIFIECWVIGLAVLLILYFVWFRQWQMHWGATAEEVTRRMAGDERIESPHLNATRVVEIDAPPEDVWPWVAQMGYKRGGFYNFDNLDNGGLPSAERILPEYQNLKVGDLIHPIIQVAEMEPNKSMLWIFSKGTPWEGATWSWGFYRTDDGHTRLVSRLRQKYTFDTLEGIIVWPVTDVTEIAMMRTCLLGIKHRVEGESLEVPVPAKDVPYPTGRNEGQL